MKMRPHVEPKAQVNLLEAPVEVHECQSQCCSDDAHYCSCMANYLLSSIYNSALSICVLMSRPKTQSICPASLCDRTAEVSLA